jgi:hypothetical protein
VREYLGTDGLYDEVREEIQDMSEYLDSDALRRQANTVVRLTVVTVFGLIGTVTTGFLGMNLISEAENPLWLKLAYFALVRIPTLWLTVYTMVKSKRLSGLSRGAVGRAAERAREGRRAARRLADAERGAGGGSRAPLVLARYVRNSGMSGREPHMQNDSGANGKLPRPIARLFVGLDQANAGRVLVDHSVRTLEVQEHGARGRMPAGTEDDLTPRSRRK